jgi:hypothetical protein
MRIAILLSSLFVAACASTSASDLKRMSTAEVCYMGATQPEHQQMVDAEIAARKANCNDHMVEMQKMRDMEMRAGRMGEGVGDATPKGGTSSGGGMGRGY